MEGTVGCACAPCCANSETSICGQDACMGEDGERKHHWEKVGEVKIRWEEKEKDCVGRERVGGEGGRERKRRLEVGGKERKKMHKQMLALGIDAISSVSQLMTNSMEEREEQKESSNGVSKSKREKQKGLCE